MTLEQLKAKRTKLNAEFDIVDKEIKKRTIVGWRAICYGDDYNYGGSSDYLIKVWGREAAKRRAEECAKLASNGGHIEEIYPDTPPRGRVN